MFEQLKGINKETLQYMFSDVLNADAISYMNERVNQIVDYVEKNDVKIVDTFDKDTYKLMKSCPVMYRVEESQNKIKKLFAMEAAKEAKKKAAEEAEKKADEEPKKEQAAEEPKKEEAAEAPKRKPAPTAPQRKQAPEEPKKEDAPEAPKRKPAPTAPKRVATNFKELSKSDWKSQSSPREQKFTIGRSRDKKPAEKKPSGLGMQ